MGLRGGKGGGEGEVDKEAGVWRWEGNVVVFGWMYGESGRGVLCGWAREGVEGSV